MSQIVDLSAMRGADRTEVIHEAVSCPPLPEYVEVTVGPARRSRARPIVKVTHPSGRVDWLIEDVFGTRWADGADVRVPC